MEEEGSNPIPSSPPPHVLIFPLPALGHVTSMLKLAEVLSLAGIDVTFLNTHRGQKSLFRCTDIESRFSRFPGFRFTAISDGLEMDAPLGLNLAHLIESMNLKSRQIFKQLLIDINPPVDCVIADGIFGFVLDTAIELGVPIIHFRTTSACCFWANFSIPDIIEAGEIPIKGEEDMDRLITKVPGMETFLRCRDLPTFCRTSNMKAPTLEIVSKESRQASRAQGLIVNTFEDLEAPILSQIRNHCLKLYTIGPVHELLNTKLRSKNLQNYPDQSSNGLWEVDGSCMTWLDCQPPESVIYISFGSLAIVTMEQLMEIWHGIVNSKKLFLWVIRPDSVTSKNSNESERVPEELKEGCKENGYIVKWAPQEEVLAHKAVGGFLTHSGWNSTLESIIAGVPMICWPYFADQHINSRFVSEIWKLGLDMKDVCDRGIVEKMVNDVMVDRREEFLGSTARMAELARKSVSEGGSSSCNLNRLIEDFKMMKKQDN